MCLDPDIFDVSCYIVIFDLCLTHSFRYRGISDDELSAFAGSGEKEASTHNWREIVGWTEESRNKQAFRVSETSVLEIN